MGVKRKQVAEDKKAKKKPAVIKQGDPNDGFVVDKFDRSTPINIQKDLCCLCHKDHDFGILLKRVWQKSSGGSEEQDNDEMDDCGEVDIQGEDHRDVQDVDQVWVSKFSLQNGGQKNHTKRLFVHFYCALASPRVWYTGTQWKNVFREITRSRGLTCSHCGGKTASIGCSEGHCKVGMHLHCALANGFTPTRYNSNIFYCPTHKKAQQSQQTPTNVTYNPLDDLSKGTDALPIPVINRIDTLSPLDTGFCYVNQTIDSDDVVSNFHDLSSLTCCDCEDLCDDLTRCACLQAGSGRNYTSFGKLIPQSQSQSAETRAPVLECNFRCACSYRRCTNRVVAKGITHRLAIVRSSSTTKRPWYVQTLDAIPQDAFVCEITGQLVLHPNTLPTYPDTAPRYPNTSSSSSSAAASVPPVRAPPLLSFATWEGVARTGANTVSFGEFSFVPYFPSDLDTAALPYADKDPVTQKITLSDLCLDCSRYGNVGAFVRHVSSPDRVGNVVARLVFTDKHKIPRLALFAARPIPALSEISLPYAVGTTAITSNSNSNSSNSEPN